MTTSADGVAAEKAYDIFEPRPDSAAAVADTPYSARPQKLPAASPSIADISKMRGERLLFCAQGYTSTSYRALFASEVSCVQENASPSDKLCEATAVKSQNESRLAV